jgi:transposase
MYYLPVGRVGGLPSSTWTRAPTTHAADGRCAGAGSPPRIARRGIESSGRLGRQRYVVEWSLAWLVGCRRLQVRYERHADILLGFVHLACALICLKSLNRVPV